MKAKSVSKTSRPIISLLFSICCVGVGILQTQAQTSTLAEGSAPLTNTMINRLAGLFEWSLQIRFSAQERSELQQLVVNYWKQNDTKSIQSVRDMLAFEQNLQGWSGTQKQQAQPQLQQKLLENFEQNPSDEMSRLLQTIYRRQHSATAQTAAISNGASTNALVGKWQVLHGNSIVSVDRISGRIGDGNGMIAEYDIKPDGRFIYSFLLQQANSGCTTRIKTSKTGRAVIEGARITFHYNEGKTTSEDSCNTKFNYTKPVLASSETFSFGLKTENGKQQLCVANEKLKDCAVKVR